MQEDKPDSEIRLNKHLALVLGVSRREADKLIESGRVKIGSDIAKIGNRFNLNKTIFVDNKPIGDEAPFVYLLFNKPVGYVCSRRRQGENPTIYDIIPEKFHSLKPVGRLDKDSSGLIILTNDGNFAYKMTHPKFYKTKIYQVVLDKDLEPLHQQMISDFGIQLEDGPSKLTLERSSDSSRKNWIITMHEGRNRQIRRTFASLGYRVTKLHRTNFGNYALNNIKNGQFIAIDNSGL